jgi:hypothetical protein
VYVLMCRARTFTSILLIFKETSVRLTLPQSKPRTRRQMFFFAFSEVLCTLSESCDVNHHHWHPHWGTVYVNALTFRNTLTAYVPRGCGNFTKLAIFTVRHHCQYPRCFPLAPQP